MVTLLIRSLLACYAKWRVILFLKKSPSYNQIRYHLVILTSAVRSAITTYRNYHWIRHIGISNGMPLCPQKSNAGLQGWHWRVKKAYQFYSFISTPLAKSKLTRSFFPVTKLFQFPLFSDPKQRLPAPPPAPALTDTTTVAMPAGMLAGTQPTVSFTGLGRLQGARAIRVDLLSLW